MARSYDVQLGRWMQPDPMMQHASPYLAMGNNPTVYTDPLGLEDGWDDYIGYDQDGNEVARSKREGKDRYFSLIRSGEGTWELVGELDEAPRLKRGGGNGDFYREPIDNLKASFYLPMSAAIMAHNAKLDAEEARSAAIWHDLRKALVLSNPHEVIGGAGPLELIGGVAGGVNSLYKGVTVLGKYPTYINLAKNMGAKFFSIPSKIWNKMSEASQWAANKKFLDRAIARGDDIVLSNPVKSVQEATGAFRKELEYLIEKGYRLAEDGKKMIR